MNLIGEKVVLRAIEEKDLPYLKDLVNDPELESKVVGYSYPVSTQDQMNWYKNAVIGNQNNLRFAVTADDEIIGLATLGDFDWKNRSAFHGMKLGKNAQGKGYGKDTVITVMKYAFEELQLNRLDGGMISSNVPSIKLYEKCGWKKEGIKRDAIFQLNQYFDYIIVGILKEDYLNLFK